MPRRKKIIISVTAVLVTIMLFAAFILPHIIRPKAVEALQKATGRTVRLDSIYINPLTLTVGLDGFSIEDNGGGPFVNIGSLRASLGFASIYRRALILSSVTIESPAISFTRTGANQYSFSDIIDRINAQPKTEPSGDAHFSINNISIRDGYVDFFDKAVSGGKKHTIRKLELNVPFISNIPYLVEKYTDPKMSAEVNGAEFKFNGKVKPLSKSMETSIHVNLKQLNLPELVAYSPQKPPANMKSGKLSIDADVTYRISAYKKPELAVKGLIQLQDISVNMPDGKPLMKLADMSAKAAKLEVFAQSFDFDSIAFDQLELFVNRDSKGRWTHDLLMTKTKPPVKEVKNKVKAKDAPVQVSIANFTLSKSSLHFSDAVPKGGFKTAISSLDFKINNFSTAKDKTADYQLAMMIEEAAFKSSGQFSATPVSAKASMQLTGLKLQKGWPYASQFLTAPVNGTLDISSDLSFSQEKGLVTEKGKLTIRDISTRFNRKEGFDLALLSIDDAGFNQKENSVSIRDITLSKGNLNISREADGKLSPMALFVAAKTAAPAAATAGQTQQQPPKPQPKPKSGKQTDDLKYSVKQFTLEKFNIAFRDKTHEEAPVFKLRDTSLSLADINGPKFTPAQLKFATIYGKRASIRANGMLTPEPFRYKGDINIRRLPIGDFDDYLPENLNVAIINGNLDTRLRLDVALKDGKPFGSFRGTSGIRGFHSIDTTEEEDLLKWESLQLDNYSGTLEPISLSVGQISLSSFYSRIIVRKDGTLNLQNLMDKPVTGEQAQGAGEKVVKKEQPKTGTTDSKPSLSSPQSPVPGHKIKIGAITVQGGTLSFTDNHLPQRFSTTFFNLGGRVSGLSSETSQMADVDLRGNLENQSPLQITGKINPLREDLFVDLKISFRDIELTPATPYTGTFLGYTVEKGKLFLDLKYHIEKKELNSENKIFVDQFTFGNKVQSEKATSLPVKLGLALLKDRKGEIHLDVPVTGRTDDPQFSIWRLVFQVLKNLMVKAVTSPFSLLSSMFGGGEDLSTINFTSGSSVLKPQEETKLNALAKALEDRPALKLEIKAYVDRERDAEGYKAELLERKIRNEKYLALVKTQKSSIGGADSIKVLPAEYSGYLKAVYKKEKFPKPRNFIGMVKDLPDAEMKKLIITNTAVGANELRSLAQDRNSAVMNHLISKGKVDSKRVFQKIDDIYKKPAKDGASGSRVEMNALVQ